MSGTIISFRIRPARVHNFCTPPERFQAGQTQRCRISDVVQIGNERLLRGSDGFANGVCWFRGTPMQQTMAKRGEFAAVFAVWAAMSGTLLTWVALYGSNVPWREDWLMVPALVGKEPHLLEWLWAQNMEHRTPLQRAVYLILLKATDGDFRIGMVANTMILSGLSFAMIVMARRLRGGRTRLADAFFPLMLLHPGQLENIFLGWQLQLVISTGLVGVWLLIIVDGRWPMSPKVAVAAGLTPVLLPLLGGNGLIVAPFVALWLAASTLLNYRMMPARWMVLFQGGCVFLSIALIGLYFVGYEQLAQPTAGVLATLVTATRLAGMALGPVGAGTGRVFPESMIGVLICGIAVLLWASAIIPLNRGFRCNRSGGRVRVFGLLIFGAASGALVLLIAWGRAGLVPGFGLPPRYAVLIAPGLCAAYFAWVLYGSQGHDRVAIGFVTAVLLALPFNIREGLRVRDAYVAGMSSFEQDLSDGLSWQSLAERHQQFLMSWDYAAVMKGMQLLHDAKMGPWRDATTRY